jgi:hypothetical protein
VSSPLDAIEPGAMVFTRTPAAAHSVAADSLGVLTHFAGEPVDCYDNTGGGVTRASKSLRASARRDTVSASRALAIVPGLQSAKRCLGSAG